MKKLILNTTLVISIAFSPSSFAIMGVGDIVSDPASYSYYAKQLRQGAKELETGKQQLKNALEIKNLTDDTLKSLKGSLHRAQNFIKKMQDCRDNFKSDPWGTTEDVIRDENITGDENVTGNENSVQKKLNNLYRKASNSMNPATTNYDEWVKALDLNDKNGVSMPKKPHWIASREAKDRYLIRKFTQAIQKSVKADAMVNIQLKEFEKLATNADSANTLKDSTDMTNAILLKMLHNQSILIELVSSANQIMTYNAQIQTNTKGNKGEKYQALKNIDADKILESFEKGSETSDSENTVKSSISLFGDEPLTIK